MSKRIRQRQQHCNKLFRDKFYLILFGDDCVKLLLIIEHLNALRENGIERCRMVAEFEVVLAAP